MTVVMAFAYFRDKNTDIAIIETGLGGRLDSTNVFKC
jgi:dihydrofolate synthase/folylpolyglutamate synthase